MQITEYDDLNTTRTSLFTLAGGFLAFLIVVAFAYGAYHKLFPKDPVARIAREHQRDIEQRARLDDMEGERRYRLLQSEVEAILLDVRQEFSSLRGAANAFSRQVEAIVGVPLDIAHIKTTQRLDHAILRSDEFTETWSQILNARLTAQMIDYKESVVQDVSYRLERRLLSERDRSKLLDLTEWIQHQHQKLNDQQGKLAIIQNALHPSDHDQIAHPMQEGDSSHVYSKTR